MNKLHENIEQLPAGKTTRRAYAIPDLLHLQLLQFCLKHGVNKSDVLALAISELIEKYESE